jgi:hypothetical protein
MAQRPSCSSEQVGRTCPQDCDSSSSDEDEYNLVGQGPGKDLCFATMWDDSIVVPRPLIRRSPEMAKAALQKAGHKGFFSSKSSAGLTLLI